MTARDIVMSSAGNAGDSKTYIEDVFSTYLYTGDGGALTIDNGINLAGKGGLVWVKARSGVSALASHCLADTVRGVGQILRTHSTAGTLISNDVSAFTSSGFKATYTPNVLANDGSTTYASWTFRKAPKFFDVVTYTGNGNAYFRQVAHNLGVRPGMIIIKRLNASGNWGVWHRGNGISDYSNMSLNATNASGGVIGSTTEMNASTFRVDFVSDHAGTANPFNGLDQPYVAYLFAHDTTTDGLIQCGSFTTDASGAIGTINLGWEPQYIMMKPTSTTGDWTIRDTMRGCSLTSGIMLRANTSAADYDTGSGDYVQPTATGFKGTGNWFGSNVTVAYMAIRRGPMRTPTDGTKVFNPAISGTNSTPSFTTTYPVDLLLARTLGTTDPNWYWSDRLRGADRILRSTNTSQEIVGSPGYYNFYQNGCFSGIWDGYRGWTFRRAPGFFDVVCYTGNSTSSNTPRSVSHNLGVTPELIIVKGRSSTDAAWLVGYNFTPTQFDNGYLYSTNGSNPLGYNIAFFGAAPTSTTFSVVNQVATNPYVNNSNWNGNNYVAYLFASCPGVSKVGSYTGNGSSQTINCGFTNGARFVLIKRTDSAGDWYVWDTARGIVANNDPHLSLNTTSAEVTTNDSVDPDASGFVVNQVAATNVNVNAATYIYLAIA